MAEPSDATLARRSAAGDKEAFVELVRRHQHGLAALIRYRIADSHEAEDVFQETLFQAWVGIRRLRDPEKVWPWLLQVARNRCRDFYRSPQRRQRPTNDEKLTAHLNRYGRPSSVAREVAGEVWDALEHVPEPERGIAKLFYMKGLTIAEIAKRSRSPAGTVKRRLFDARRHMREALGPPSVKRKKEKSNE